MLSSSIYKGEKNRLGSVSDPDPNTDPDVFGPPGSGSGSISLRHGSGSFFPQAKIVRKTSIPTVLLLFFDFSSLKYDVNVHAPSKVMSRKTCFLLVFCWSLEGQ